jgi:uncharacterized protein (DUF1330 family)
MPAYVIVDITIHDLDTFRAYAQGSPATIAQYGGRYLARGGKVGILEGEWSPERLVILEFESAEHARAWLASPEYRAIIGLRHRSAHTNMVVIDGV